MIAELPNHAPRIGVLYSGGLDSAILVAHLLQRSRDVVPIFVESDLVWQRAELRSARRFLAGLPDVNLHPLVVLQAPLADVYGDHWSTGTQHPPNLDAADIEVDLPGRNGLILMTAGRWCQQHGVSVLTIATLGTSPFADARPEYFHFIEALLNRSGSNPVRISAPFANMQKAQVLALGSGLPLERTFSCLAPLGDHHCGRCNKCGERSRALSDLRSKHARGALLDGINETVSTDEAEASKLVVEESPRPGWSPRQPSPCLHQSMQK